MRGRFIGPHSPAACRAANAATAYLSIGKPARVTAYARQALAAFDRAGLRGPQALSRLDLATAELYSDSPQLDTACGLVVEALTITSEQRFQPVNQRAREFIAAARPWRQVPAVKEILGLVHDHGRHPPPRPALPSSP